MSDDVEKITLAEALAKNKIEFGSRQHIQLIEASYGLTVQEANTIVKEWRDDHRSWPLTEVRKAQAMLEIIKAKPVVIDQTPGWKRAPKDY